MANIKYVIILIISFFISINTAFSNLEIIEVYPNPNAWEEEYIIVKNNSNGEIKTSDYIISDKSWKSYKIWEPLSWFETKKLYESETKIKLNNSDEELYIKDKNWKIVDSFIYKDSQKWQKLDKNSLNISENDNIKILSKPVFEKEKNDNSSIYFYIISIIALLWIWFTLNKKRLTK